LPDLTCQHLIIVAADVGKAQVMNRLEHGTSIRFSADLPLHFYEMLMGERLTVTYSRGVPMKRWVPVPGRRNEGLDCVSYGLAARAMVNGNADRRAAELSSPVTQAERKPATPVRREGRRSLLDKGPRY